jgi:hypothetical protein
MICDISKSLQNSITSLIIDSLIEAIEKSAKLYCDNLGVIGYLQGRLDLDYIYQKLSVYPFLNLKSIQKLQTCIEYFDQSSIGQKSLKFTNNVISQFYSENYSKYSNFIKFE